MFCYQKSEIPKHLFETEDHSAALMSLKKESLYFSVLLNIVIHHNVYSLSCIDTSTLPICRPVIKQFEQLTDETYL
jgi:hypothetical protein